MWSVEKGLFQLQNRGMTSNKGQQLHLIVGNFVSTRLWYSVLDCGLEINSKVCTVYDKVLQTTSTTLKAKTKLMFLTPSWLKHFWDLVKANLAYILYIYLKVPNLIENNDHNVSELLAVVLARHVLISKLL